MPQILDLGRLRFHFQGPWSASASYELNDVVKYGGSAYVYINSTTSSGNNPNNTTYWSVMTDGFQWENAWSASTQYQKNDVVVYGPQTYIAIQDTIGNTPENATYWKVFTGGLEFKGNWTTASAYYPGDIVLRGTTGYIANQYHVANAQFSSDLSNNVWDLFTRGVRYRGSWSASTQYLIDDLVIDGVTTYIAMLDHTSGTGLFSAEDPARWDVFAQGADYLPAQLGQGDKILTTDGTDPAWTDSLNLQGSVVIDSDNSFKVGESAVALAGPGSHDFTDAMAVFSTDTAGGNSDAFAQFVIVNGNSDGYGSTDFIAYTYDGSNDSGWVDMGITGANFNSETYGITGPHDGYVFYVAPEGTTGEGNLVFATGDTGTANKLIFAAGGLAAGTTQMEITPGQNVHVEISTESISPTTGALTVAGGAGIQGNLNVLGNQEIVGNMVIQGSISVAGGQFVTENLSSTDPLLFVGNLNEGNEFDLGFLVEQKLPSASARILFDTGVVSASVATLTTASYAVTIKALTNNTATLTIGAHSFLPGDAIRITGVDATFNGDYIVSAITETTISYAKTNANITQTAASGTAQFRIITGFGGTLIASDFITISGGGVFDGNHHLSFVNETQIRWNSSSASYTSTNFSPDAVGTRTTRSKFSGIVKDNATLGWYLFSNLEAKPTTSIDFTLPELEWDSLKMGQLTAVKGFNIVNDPTERDQVYEPIHGTIIYRKDRRTQEVYTGSKWDAIDPIHPFLLMGV